MKRIYGLLFLVLLLLLTGCGKSTEEKWQEQYDLGMQYLEEGDYEAAIVAFTAAIEIEPNELTAYTSLAQTYMENRDYSSAITIIDQAMEIMDNGAGELTEEDWNSFLDIAMESYVTVNDIDRLYAFCCSVLEFCQEEDEITVRTFGASALVQIGYQYQDASNEEMALNAFMYAIDLCPDYVEAYIAMADIYVQSGETDAAKEILETGYQMTGDASLKEYLDMLNDSFIQNSDYDFVMESALSEEEKSGITAIIDVLREENLDAVIAYAAEAEETLFNFAYQHLEARLLLVLRIHGDNI